MKKILVLLVMVLSFNLSNAQCDTRQFKDSKMFRDMYKEMLRGETDSEIIFELKKAINVQEIAMERYCPNSTKINYFPKKHKPYVLKHKVDTLNGKKIWEAKGRNLVIDEILILSKNDLDDYSAYLKTLK